MATYKFEQFNTEIKDPSITIDADQIQVHATRNTISLLVTLETSNAIIYGVELKEIPVSNLNYEGAENLMDRALEGLQKHIV